MEKDIEIIDENEEIEFGNVETEEIEDRDLKPSFPSAFLSSRMFPVFTIKNCTQAILSLYQQSDFSYDTATKQHLFQNSLLDNEKLRFLASQINDQYNFQNFNFSLFLQAVQTICEQNSFDSLKKFFDDMPTWDGIDRISTFFTDYFNAEESFYSADVAKKFFVGAVARVYNPGFKFDFCPVLSGPQGIGKTYFLTLLTNEKFVASIDQSDDFGTAKTVTKCQGKIFVVFEELAFLSKKAISHVKQLITQCEDTTRLPYQPMSTTFPRRFIFVGNTNESEFLNDDTGNRRFLPIACKKGAKKSIFEHLLNEKAQIWAQAIALYKSNEQLHTLPPDLESVTEYFSVSDSKDEVLLQCVQSFFESKIEKNCIQFPSLLLTNWLGSTFSSLSDQRKATSILKEMGWEKSRRRFNGVLTHCFIKK